MRTTLQIGREHADNLRAADEAVARVRKEEQETLERVLAASPAVYSEADIKADQKRFAPRPFSLLCSSLDDLDTASPGTSRAISDGDQPRETEKGGTSLAEQLGENIRVEVKGDELVITINLKHRGSESSSGKSIIVASTKGNVNVPGTTPPVQLGLNAYIKK